MKNDLTRRVGQRVYDALGGGALVIAVTLSQLVSGRQERF